MIDAVAFCTLMYLAISVVARLLNVYEEVTRGGAASTDPEEPLV